MAAALAFLAAAASTPLGAAVSRDLAAGLPVPETVANGLGGGLSLEAVMGQALEEGADPCELVKACLSQGADLARIFTFLLNRAPAGAALAPKCTACELLQCAVKAGLDRVEAANALMSAGAKLEDVRACLAGLGYANAETYTYSPPGPPAAPMALGPVFPGGGGGLVKPPVASPAQ